MRRFIRWIGKVLVLGRRFLVYLAVVLLAYLLQVCVMPDIRFGGVSPNLLYAVAAVITVCYGRLRAYWTGAVFGILTEITMPSLKFFNLVVYPLLISFSAVFFADKSEKRIEEERSQGKPGRNGNVYLRTVLDVCLCMVLHETIHITYMFLGGADLTAAQMGRAGTGILLTAALTALIMVPLRRLLGFRHPVHERAAVRGRYLRRV